MYISYKYMCIICMYVYMYNIYIKTIVLKMSNISLLAVTRAHATRAYDLRGAREGIVPVTWQVR